METRHVALVTILSICVGLVFGVIAGALFIGQPSPPDASLVQLDKAEQDDFIIAAAEAYAGDHDVQLLHDRLSRLNTEDIGTRVEYLALDYSLQRDLISNQLAGLAVALGSHNITLIAANLSAQPRPIAQRAPVPTPLIIKTNKGGAVAIARATPTRAKNAPASGKATLSPPTSGGGPPTAVPEPPVPTAVAKNAGGKPAAPPAVPEPTPAAPSSQLAKVQPTKQSGGAGGGPAATPGAVALKPKPPAPTQPAAAAAKPNTGQKQASAPSPVVRNQRVNLPGYVHAAEPSIPFNAQPSKCTPASEMPEVVDRTISLCADQVYKPFRVSGSNLTVYGDSGGTARIHAPGRAFGITVTGSNITITGVHIEADTDPADLNTWLCLYENCNFKGKKVRGAANYGGGILLDHTTNVAVVGSTVSKGTIGVASVHGSNNKIVDNNLSNLNGWGALLFWSNNNAVVGNTLNRVTRSCNGPDGGNFTTGCESAGIAAIRALSNLIVSNRCERSSNCLYASGEGGFSSNDNKIFNNYCAGSPHNCFELTFSAGNQLDYNVATSGCNYPFWISGSNVDLGSHNKWSCKLTAKQAFTESKQATKSRTSASGF